MNNNNNNNKNSGEKALLAQPELESESVHPVQVISVRRGQDLSSFKFLKDFMVDEIPGLALSNHFCDANSVSDPHSFHTDPDPAQNLNVRMRIHADPDPVAIKQSCDDFKYEYIHIDIFSSFHNTGEIT